MASHPPHEVKLFIGNLRRPKMKPTKTFQKWCEIQYLFKLLLLARAFYKEGLLKYAFSCFLSTQPIFIWSSHLDY